MLDKCTKCSSEHISVCVDLGQGRAACLLCGHVETIPVADIQPAQSAAPAPVEHAQPAAAPTKATKTK